MHYQSSAYLYGCKTRSIVLSGQGFKDWYTPFLHQTVRESFIYALWVKCTWSMKIKGGFKSKSASKFDLTSLEKFNSYWDSPRWVNNSNNGFTERNECFGELATQYSNQNFLQVKTSYNSSKVHRLCKLILLICFKSIVDNDWIDWELVQVPIQWG